MSVKVPSNTVRVACLSDYAYPGTTADAHVLVINYSNVDVDALEKSLPRVEQALLNGD